MGTFAATLCLQLSLVSSFITWLPFYLVRERHFSVPTNVRYQLNGLPHFGDSALLSGWLFDKWIAPAALPRVVRKTFTGAGPLIASSIMPVVIVCESRRAVALLLLSCVGLGMCTSNLWSADATLAGPATSGKWTGVQNFTGNLAGWINSPPLIGLIVQRTGNFFWVFVITSIVTVLGAGAWIFVVGPIKPVAWQRPA